MAARVTSYLLTFDPKSVLAKDSPYGGLAEGATRRRCVDGMADYASANPPTGWRCSASTTSSVEEAIDRSRGSIGTFGGFCTSGQRRSVFMFACGIFRMSRDVRCSVAMTHLTSRDSNLLLATALNRDFYDFLTAATGYDARRVWWPLPDF